MTTPKPLTDWQLTLPEVLPRHIRRNIELVGECWQWTRSLGKDGYGWASNHNKTYEAHRLVYLLVVGAIADGLHLDHLCHTRDLACLGGKTCAHRRCVRPAHLEPVTVAENLARSIHTTSGMTVCDKGHPLTVGKRQRRCEICCVEYENSRREHKRLQAREYRRRKAAAA